jgi:F0F1-type ATP synthase membrane subunit b/b'
VDARAAAVAQARERAQQLIAQAKAEIEQECSVARTTLEADSDRIANQIIEILLQPAGAGPAAFVSGR